MLTVNELAKMSLISVRTLHYYDKIGLLKPHKIKDNGYRLYSEVEEIKLKDILFLKELEFSLKQINDILKSNISREVLLEEQKELLKVKRQRIDRLINMIERGSEDMDFKEFDNSEFESKKDEYAEEAKLKYEGTLAYKEYEKKNRNRTAEEEEKLGQELNNIFSRFSEYLNVSTENKEVQFLVVELQEFITKNYYNCTDDILKGLGKMYIEDARFNKNIDKHGKGTANFISQAITYYFNEKGCKK